MQKLAMFPGMGLRCRALETHKDNIFLIVENNANDAFLIKHALRAASCGKSFVCRNASEATSFLKGAGMYTDRALYPLPNILIVDIQLDGESGLEFVEWVRLQEPPIGNLTVIILSGEATTLHLDGASRVGAQRIYRKPTKIEDLERLLKQISSEFCG